MGIELKLSQLGDYMSHIAGLHDNHASKEKESN
jgi:hypothetical protein